MATEDNKFDKLLKERLHRDLVFRGFVWIAVPGIASYYAIRVEDIDALEFMMRTTSTVMRILDILGSFALFLSIAALMFKDLESTNEKVWGQHTKKGYFGAVLRRLAGDLTTWALGAVLTIVTVTFLAVVLANTSLAITALLIFFFVVLLSWIFVIGLMNILVRSSEPTLLASKFKRPYQLALAYGVTLVIFPAIVWIK